MATNETDDDRIYADLAESVLTLAREIRLREAELEDTISLTPSYAQVMRYVSTHPGATPSETADATGLLRSNLSTALRELEKIGFVEKRQSAEDGRGVRLYPTDTALGNLGRVREQWAADAERLLGKTTGVSRTTTMLRTLAEGLAAERQAAGRQWSRRQM
ncbi:MULTISPECIES: MarR family winged helix-turn-helix transcriptional regulator [unclassified Curtobacterium]|uniref:MarR family winged helix-turn-helix transcriptional regulator n=1 Tax=unclassified Curtobacterium TaxID=257496 RepID=UPI00382D0A50